MLLNIINVLYFLIRLAPFIIVTYFTIQFLFTQNTVGIIYIIGLIAACSATVILGNYNTFKAKNVITTDLPKFCKIMDLTKTGPLSNIPLGQTILGYTLSFGIYILYKNKLIDNNINSGNFGFIVVLFILILGDLLWNISNKCAESGILVISLIIGSGCGLAWALLLDVTKNQTNIDLTQFNNFNSNNLTKCTMINNTYTCTQYN